MLRHQYLDHAVISEWLLVQIPPTNAVDPRRRAIPPARCRAETRQLRFRAGDKVVIHDQWFAAIHGLQDGDQSAVQRAVVPVGDAIYRLRPRLVLCSQPYSSPH